MNDAAPTLDDYLEQLAATAGETGRRHALAAIAENDRQWTSIALNHIEQLAQGGEFTAEDLRARVGAGPSPMGSLGAVFKLACRERLIVRVGYRPSKIPSRHGAPIAVWRGRSAGGRPV